MRIAVVGGGPAGLYFALLMKRQQPEHEIKVFERNPRHNTFGWGVVFSDRTLSYLEEPDPETFRAMGRRLVTWDNVDVVHRGEKVSIRGNRFSGIARIELLRVLQRRCLELGVEIAFESEVGGLDELPEADLVVGADGVRSLVRDAGAGVLEPELDWRPNRYVWYGTPRIFNGLTLTFRHGDDGLFIAHSYKFSTELSTFIVECDEATFRRSGLGEAGDEESRAYLEALFADDLHGEPLLSNQSAWIRFVTVRNARWHDGNRVLLGDAAHTAHFSIGSGTKMALEDAIALAGALGEHGDELEAAFSTYEAARRPRVERLQSAAQASLEWFETATADLELEPVPFAYRVMTRSGRIDQEELRRRDPAFAAQVEAAGLVEVGDETGETR
jgi:anthraniloyl-CoA monooxygenase